MEPAQGAAIVNQEKNQKEQWRPFLIGNRMRTTSEDSAESFDAYDLESPSSTERRFSLTERFFGSFEHRRNSASESEKPSITKNIDLKEFMKRQRKVLGDDEWQ